MNCFLLLHYPIQIKGWKSLQSNFSFAKLWFLSQPSLGHNRPMEATSLAKSLHSVCGHGYYQHLVMVLMSIVWMTASFWPTGLPLMMAPPEFLCEGVPCSETEACASTETSVYSDTSPRTVASEWGLVCSKNYIVQAVETAFLAGIVTGSMVLSWAANHWGRKPVLLAAYVTYSTALLLSAFAPSFNYFAALAVLAGLSYTGLAAPCSLLQSEIVDNEYREWYFGISFSAWGASAALFAVASGLVRDWRTVNFVCGLLALTCVPFLLWIDESPRFLLEVQHDVKAANRVLARVAEYNGTVGTRVDVKGGQRGKGDRRGSEVDTWVVVRLASVASLWVGVVIGYYGIVYCLPTYMGSIYLNASVLSLSEVPANLLTSYFMNRIGRKSTCLSLFLLGAVSTLSAALCGHLHSPTGQIAALFVARSALTALFLLIYVYTLELFPTYNRSWAMGVSMTVGKAGGMLAPNLVLVAGVLGVGPLVLIGAVMGGSCGVTVTLPETKGCEMGRAGREDGYVPLLDKVGSE